MSIDTDIDEIEKEKQEYLKEHPEEEVSEANELSEE